MNVQRRMKVSEVSAAGGRRLEREEEDKRKLCSELGAAFLETFFNQPPLIVIVSRASLPYIQGYFQAKASE
jgi:hypothetical protein